MIPKGIRFLWEFSKTVAVVNFCHNVFKIFIVRTRMAQKKKKSKLGKKKSEGEEAAGIQFRERKFGDVIKGLKHPKPIPGYKATLPGPPGWQAKERPGA